MARDNGTTRVDCKILREGENSVKVEVEDGRQIFIPHSALHQIHRQDGYIVIDNWLAQREDLL